MLLGKSPQPGGGGGLATRALLVSTRRLWGKAAEPSPDTAWEAAHQPLGPKVPPSQGRGAGARGSARRDGSRPPCAQQAAPQGQEGPAPPVPAPHSSQGPLPAARHRPRSAPQSSLVRGRSPVRVPWPSRRSPGGRSSRPRPSGLRSRLPPLGIGHGSGAGAPPTTSPAGSKPAGVPGVVHPAQETALSTSNHARSASVRSQAAWPQGGPGSRLPAPEPAAGWRPPHGQLAASSPLARVCLAELVPRGPRGRPCGGDVGAGAREPQRRRWACGCGRGVTARGEAASEDA